MPTPVDRVQVLKQESSAGGGDPLDQNTFDTWDAINETEDALSSTGLFVQKVGGPADENVLVWREADALMLKDGANPSGKALSDLGGGVSNTNHRTLRQLIHLAEEGGPFEGFASGAYQETLPSSDPFPTSIIWWESTSKLKKIVEETIAYNANKTISTDQWRVYDTDGSTVLATVTDTISYSGIFETSRTRAVV